MIKVGEHITIDFLGVKKDYSPEFYEKVIYKIAKAAKVEILNVASHKFEAPRIYISCAYYQKVILAFILFLREV